MDKQAIEFLKSLQHEMLTQDHVCQASPRFWVIRQTVKDYWISDSEDGIFIYSREDAETVFEGKLEHVAEWLKDLDGVTECNSDECMVSLEYAGRYYMMDCASEIESFLEVYDEGNYSVGNYRERDEIVPDTFFLTNRECKDHLKANAHHYNKTAHSYAMTAWRSPQVECLYKILENTNWEELLSE